MPKGLFYTGHQISLLVFVARNKNTLVIFTSYRAGKSVPLLRDMEKPDGSSVLVLNSGLCNMKCLGVLPLSLDGILVYYRLPLVFCQVSCTIGRYYFHSLEGRGTGRVKCLA